MFKSKKPSQKPLQQPETDSSINQASTAPTNLGEVLETRSSRSRSYSTGSVPTPPPTAPMKVDGMIIKCFTRWWNSWLEPKGTKVTDLLEQIKGGTMGMTLLDAVTGSVLGRFHKEPNGKFQILANHACFINNLTAKGLIFNATADDLFCGDAKAVLEVTWAMILKFEVEKYGCDEAELLEWCKEIANGYEFTVTSFDSLEPKVSPPHHHCPWLRCA